MSVDNMIYIEGNLVRDPELKETPKGTPVCTFSIASNRYYKQEVGKKNEVSFFEIESWAKQATYCAETLTKGLGVKIVGRLKQDRWVDMDGKNHSLIKVVAEHVDPKFKFNASKKANKTPQEEVINF